nr:DUF4262 domain-containing protein [Microbacterium bovistercoris]
MTFEMDPATQAWLDQEDQRTAQIIRKYGTYNEYVIGDPDEESPSFAYSVGLFGLGHPELLVFGVGQTTACHILNDIAARVRAGADLVAGEVVTFDGWGHRALVEPVPNPGEIVFAANRFYQRPSEASVPVYQLTLDDQDGRFPGQDGYARPAWVQPRPGEFRA